ERRTEGSSSTTNTIASGSVMFNSKILQWSIRGKAERNPKTEVRRPKEVRSRNPKTALRAARFARAILRRAYGWQKDTSPSPKALRRASFEKSAGLTYGLTRNRKPASARKPIYETS